MTQSALPLTLAGAVLASALLWLAPPVSGQDPARKGAKGGGFRGPDPLVLDHHEGFESIFDGTRKNWDGDKDFWRAENGLLIGESTQAKPLTRNTFIIWRGGKPADFELKLEYRINSTNSGVQYRSVELAEAGPYVMKGYQADIDFNNTYTGQLYEERGRGFLAMRGQATHIEEGKKARIIGNLRASDELKAQIKPEDWNQLHIIARGNTLAHILNGHLTSFTVDDDTPNRSLSGLIGFQLHVGPPMKVEFRNIWLKQR